MISLQPISNWEKVKEFFNPRLKRRREEDLRQAIDQLMHDPSMACKIGDITIPNGYGKD